MTSEPLGTSTSPVEVSNISKHGLWVLLEDRELFLAFEHFPWFKDAPLVSILNIELPRPGHLRWPDLDVDLTVDIIEHPEKYPLVSRSRA